MSVILGGVLFPVHGQFPPVELTELVENFDGAAPPDLPPGWVSHPVTGASGIWSTHPGTINPYGGTYQAKSLPNLVYFNAYNLDPNQSARLRLAQPLNFSRVLGGMLRFDMVHDIYPTNYDRLQVQVSTDGGGTWQNAGDPIPRYDGTSGWATHTVSLDAFAGRPAILVGLLGISDHGNNIHLDNLEVTVLVPLVPMLRESFDQQNVLPGGWLKKDVHLHGDWLAAAGTNHPAGRDAYSPPNLVYFSANLVDADTRNRLYYGPGFDLKSAGEALLHFWMFHDPEYPSSDDRIQVQVSTDRGDTWTNVGPEIHRYNGYRGWRPYEISLQGYAGSTRVWIGFLGIAGLGDGQGNDIHLDDVAVYRDPYRTFIPHSARE